MDFATLATMFVTASLAPWLSKHGFTLSDAQQNWFIGLAVAAPTAVVHWYETKFKQKKSATLPAPVAASTAAVKALALVACAVLLSVGLQGCADVTKLEQKITSPGGQVISQVTVDIAVGAVVGNGSDAKTRAASIKSVAQKVLAADQGTTVALSALVAVANAQIAQLKLSPAEQAGAALLVSSLSALASNAVAPAASGTATTASTAVVDVQVVVAQLLNEVVTAVGGYGV